MDLLYNKKMIFIYLLRITSKVIVQKSSFKCFLNILKVIFKYVSNMKYLISMRECFIKECFYHLLKLCLK